MTQALLLTGAAVAAGVVVILLAWGWVMVKTDPPVPRYLVRPPARRKAQLPRDEGGPLTAVFQGIGRPFAGLLASLVGPERMRRAQRRIGAAGKANILTPERYAARRAGAIVLFGVLGVLLFLTRQWFAGVLFIVFGQVWVDAQLYLMGRRRSEEIERQLPDFLDILAVTVSAGLGFRRALERVTESVSGALSEEFTVALHQMELGTSRRDAFRQLRDRNNSPSLNQFMTAVLQAEELGAPLSEALIEIATDMRHNTAQVARRKAARTAPRIQLVVTFFLVPGALILFVGALVMAFAKGGGAGGVLG